MTTNPTAPSRPDAVERVIEFLSQCGDSDIEAGVGAIFGHGSDEKIRLFKAGIAAAITETIAAAPSHPVVALAQRLAKIEVQSFCAPGVDVVWKTINASLSEDERDLIVAALTSRPAPSAEATQGEIEACHKLAGFISEWDRVCLESGMGDWLDTHELPDAERSMILAALTSRPAPPVEGEIDTLQLAKDIHRHWYQHYNMGCLANDACIEAATIIDAALTSSPAIEPTQGEIEALKNAISYLRVRGQENIAESDCDHGCACRPRLGSIIRPAPSAEVEAEYMTEAELLNGLDDLIDGLRATPPAEPSTALDPKTVEACANVLLEVEASEKHYVGGVGYIIWRCIVAIRALIPEDETH